VFVPLWHPAGHGQADFGEAVAVIGGVAQKVHLFVMDLRQRRRVREGLSGGDDRGLSRRLLHS
jgi:hypothetical protein